MQNKHIVTQKFCVTERKIEKGVKEQVMLPVVSPEGLSQSARCGLLCRLALHNVEIPLAGEPYCLRFVCLTVDFILYHLRTCLPAQRPVEDIERSGLADELRNGFALFAICKEVTGCLSVRISFSAQFALIFRRIISD